MANIIDSIPSTSTSTVSENAFIRSMYHYFRKVQKYEDPILLTTARSCIPVEVLEINAIERMRQIQKKIKTGSAEADVSEVNLEEALLVELVNWFKTEFFSWVDAPQCDFCSKPTKFSHQATGMEDGEVIRIEVFKCATCNTETKFPRHQNPAKLLITRKGRCGEWGDCFTLMCRAMNYDARLVVDNSDHLWTEVYIPTLEKWLHCDPCENVVDAPLMYESGWKKKLNYIIAYSRDDVQDVTWRYSSDHGAVLKRRNLCGERELIQTLLALREKQWETMTPPRKKFVKNRLCREIVDLMTERKPTEDEKRGRSSGSLAWRLQRKETTVEPHVWKVGDFGEVCVKYRTSTDEYVMELPCGRVVERRKKWDSSVFQMENVFRKEEHDWKMCYLARTEYSDSGEIVWKFQTKKDSQTIRKVSVKVLTQLYHSGKVDWSLRYGDSTVEIPNDRGFVLENVENVTGFTLSARLSGGMGNESWQHSQIFRQEFDSMDFPLEIRILLNES